MSLERTIQRNVFQKLKILFLGKENPNFLTRFSVGIAFIIWIYLFSWHLFTILSLALLDSLKHPEKIKATFNSVGQKYGYTDTINLLTVHSLIEIGIFIFILLGLILVWRKKRIGFLFYIIGNISSLLITIFLMGIDYFSNEVSMIDLTLLISATIYFGIGALFFYKWKSKEENSHNTLDT